MIYLPLTVILLQSRWIPNPSHGRWQVEFGFDPHGVRFDALSVPTKLNPKRVSFGIGESYHYQ